MADPNVNATAQSVSDKFDGLDDNGDELTYLQVDQLAAYTGPGNYFPPEAPGITTASQGDKITTQAKVGLRLYKGLDWFDMIVALYQAAGEPTPKAP